jgi:type III restriction enzyme
MMASSIIPDMLKPNNADFDKKPSKQFHYEEQQYQNECVENIISIIENLRQSQPFVEVLNKCKQQNKHVFPVLNANNIDIMMETGTGKTFTYIKTIFELNRNFNYKKFIILTPTVPIREGTKQNFEDTKEYFKTLYANEREKEIEIFAYEGGSIAAVNQYIHCLRLSVLIMTPSSFNKDANILNKLLERDINQPELFGENAELPKTLLECLKRINPIIIMDEPHRFEGNAFKESFRGFNNYYLRFGATFPKGKGKTELSNVAYALDSISSFRQNLVKKIVVYTQDITENVDTLVAIENKKVIVNNLTNGNFVKRNIGVGGTFNGKNIKKINNDSIVLADDDIVRVDYSLSDDALRAMISQTIKIHFEKERTLFEQETKALSLFFIGNNIELFRGENPKVKIIFEEEYVKQRKKIFDSLEDCKYKKYLENDFDADGNLQTHKGYFSGDRGSADEKIKVGTEEILKDKKKLLSFESPARFIFSIWALQEGWDNPNVFTICKLSNQGSETSKLQQIGRGLRICVGQDLKRRVIKTFADNQEEFWKVNNLDIVVSNKERGFVEAIQNEILSNSFVVGNSGFTEEDIAVILQKSFDNNIVDSLINDTLKDKIMIVVKIDANGQKIIIDGKRIYEKSPEYNKILEQQDNLPADQKKALENLFASDIENFAQEKSKIKQKKNLTIKNSHIKEFKKLWKTINQNAIYTVDNLDDDALQTLINGIKTEIEALQINEILLQTIRAELNANKIGENGAITLLLSNCVSYKSTVNCLKFVEDLANITRTPISFITKIFNVLSGDFKQKILANNPAQALKEISEIIKTRLVGMIKTKISYNIIDAAISNNPLICEPNSVYFKPGECGKYQKDIATDFSLKEKWLFKDAIEYDSDFEVDIIEKDPDDNQIEIFGKLPHLKIKTPLGEYNPDFCYAIKGKNDDQQLILIVESKGYKTSADIPQKEQVKIDFAKKYFEKLNKHYQCQNKNMKIIFKERINSVQLSSLLNNVLKEN